MVNSDQSKPYSHCSSDTARAERLFQRADQLPVEIVEEVGSEDDAQGPERGIPAFHGVTFPCRAANRPQSNRIVACRKPGSVGVSDEAPIGRDRLIIKVRHLRVDHRSAICQKEGTGCLFY